MPHDTNGHRPADLTVVHTSDLHLGGRSRDGHIATLRAVLDAVEATRAQVLLLAGDTFDNHRVAPGVVDAAVAAFAATAAHVVILPGNHDPATEDAVFHRFAGPRADGTALGNVHVIGVSCGPSIEFPDLSLHVWGTPHTAYADMAPLADPPGRAHRWHIVVAHGHWVRGPHDAHRGWLMHDHEFVGTGADYVALGHWDVPQPAGDGAVPAYYSGSPEIAKSVNVVRFGDGGVSVERHPISL